MTKEYVVVLDPAEPEEYYIICIDAEPWRVTYTKIIIVLDVII